MATAMMQQKTKLDLHANKQGAETQMLCNLKFPYSILHMSADCDHDLKTRPDQESGERERERERENKISLHGKKKFKRI